MNLLNRYLFFSVAQAGLAGVGVFVFALITGNAMRDVLELFASGQIGEGMLLRLLGLLIPYAISFAAPMGFLIGILMVMGRMSSAREIIAMRSAGWSIWRITAPLLLVACLGVLGSLWVNHIHAPEARQEYKHVLRNMVREDPLSFLVPQTFIHDIPGYVIYFEADEPGQLRHLWVWELDKSSRAVRLLRAESGALEFVPEEDALLLTLQNGFTELRDPANPDNVQAVRPMPTFQHTRLRLPLESIFGKNQRATKIEHRSTPELIDYMVELRAEQRALKSLDPQAAAPSGLTGATSADRAPPTVAERLATVQAALTEVRYTISRNSAMAFSILTMSLVAIPLGIKVSRKETYANAALAIALALIYYCGMIMVDWAREHPQWHPALLLWLPNIVFLLLGLWMLYQVNRR